MVGSTAAVAQSTVSGTVMDSEMNGPLAGANVVEEGTSNGVVTDFDGNFSITTESSSGVLLVSYVGYTTIKLDFNGSAEKKNEKTNEFKKDTFMQNVALNTNLHLTYEFI